MVKPLRKYHFVLWHLLAAIIPLTFILAIVVRPKAPLEKLYEDSLSAILESDTDSTSTLTITVSRAIKLPSAVVVLSTSQGQKVLRSLNNRGVYTFDIRKDWQPVRLDLLDAIHHKPVMSIPMTQKN